MSDFETFYKSIEPDIKAKIKAEWEANGSKPTMWNPKGGEWTVDITGLVFTGDTDRESRDFGTERATRELAKVASEKMRVFNRLLAYVDEACGGYIFTAGCENAYVVFDFQEGVYTHNYHAFNKTLGTVYMPRTIASELCKKLNSGEVVL